MILKKILPFLVVSTQLFASHSQISSLRELEEEWEQSDENTLIVFDVDEVLITTEDHFMHPYADRAVMPLIQQTMSKASSKEEKKDLENTLSLGMVLPKRILIEENTPVLITDLQQNGVKVIALTNCPTGPFGLVPKVERWRVEHLFSLDISFASSFPHIERCSLDELAAAHGKPAPLFEQGILFSKGYTKGEVLQAFFKQFDYYPSKVIFIDDLSENLDSVKAVLQSLNIEFKGYQYTGANSFFKEVDEEILLYQLKHLLQTKEWLSDNEIRELLAQTLN
jgi:hypothetical protein